jgi:hypothetical protein
MQATLPHPSTSDPSTTLQQYRTVTARCKDLFLRKTSDYGTSWRVLRPVSIVDQIYIKAWRIRQIQEGVVPQVEDSVESEFVGIVNYGILALVQAALPADAEIDLSTEEARTLYEAQAASVEALMLQKNNDYGEAWREMCQESFVDLILTKLLRIKQIIANKGQTEVSEGAEANFADIVNYGVFALIKSAEAQEQGRSQKQAHAL